MNHHLRTVVAVLGKDLRSLLPFVVLTIGMLAVEVALTSLELTIGNPFLNGVVSALPQINTLVIGLLAFAVFQQDPANSVSHDWLARPLSRFDLFVAKILFLLLTITLPVFIARLLFNLQDGLTLTAAMIEASIAGAPWTLLATLLFIGVAILSRSLLHSIVLLVGVVLLFGTAGLIMDSLPRPANAFQDDVATQALIWLIVAPLYLVFVVLLAVIYWQQYERRNFVLANTLFGGGFVAAVLIVLLPFLVPAWPTYFTLLQQVIAGAEGKVAESLRLDSLYSCFPATAVNPGAGSTGIDPAQRLVGQGFWEDEELIAAGPGSVTFSTTVAARNIPRNWRVATLKVTASLAGVSTMPPLVLRPARASFSNSPEVSSGLSSASASADRDAQYDNLLTDHWLIPGERVVELRQAADADISFNYSLALLEPAEHRLATDGEWRQLQGIGHCRATREQFSNSIQLECFKRGPRPTYIATSLPAIPSSEVAAGLPAYMPGLLQSVGGSRYEARLEAASLSEESAVMVTGYEVRNLITRTLSFDGALGDASAGCALPAIGDVAPVVQSSWRDDSPHEVNYIAVEDNVRIEVLDWGGSGQPVVLIPGLGASAHSFDSLAPHLSKDYRVIGITRRGTGASTRPDHGYGIRRLSEDVLKVIDTLGLTNSVLAGHSLGGEELSWIAAHYPDRIAGLIYLDAAYDRSRENSEIAELSRKLPAQPRPHRNELTSYEAFKKYLDRIGNLGANPIPQGEIMAMLNLELGSRRLDARVLEAIMAGLSAPDYASINVPALGIFALAASADSLMEKWYDEDDPQLRQALVKLHKLRNSYQRAQIEKFRSELNDSRVMELIDADHWVFQSHREEVLSAMREFLEANEVKAKFETSSTGDQSR